MVPIPLPVSSHDSVEIVPVITIDQVIEISFGQPTRCTVAAVVLRSLLDRLLASPIRETVDLTQNGDFPKRLLSAIVIGNGSRSRERACPGLRQSLLVVPSLQQASHRCSIEHLQVP